MQVRTYQKVNIAFSPGKTQSGRAESPMRLENKQAYQYERPSPTRSRLKLLRRLDALNDTDPIHRDKSSWEEEKIAHILTAPPRPRSPMHRSSTGTRIARKQCLDVEACMMIKSSFEDGTIRRHDSREFPE